MALFFGGNPFATFVGKKIEQATDASLPSENWSLNMEICDLINETEDGPKDAVRAIRKRLSQSGTRNFNVIMYTLTVLETCVKNCNKKFLVLVCNKEFIQELVKIIGPKNDPPTTVQQRILSLIHCWANVFKNIPELQGVVQVYTELKQKGLEFPATDIDAMALIHMPKKNEDERKPTSNRTLNENTTTLSAPTSLHSDQLGKLMSELRVVEGNMAVLSEMLGELVPGKEPQSDLALMKELYTTCQAMQERLVELINQVSNDEITAELLRVNDGLNNLFLRYGRYEKNRRSIVKENETEEESLIDLTDTEPNKLSPINSQFSSLSLGNTASSSRLNAISVENILSDKGNEFNGLGQMSNKAQSSSNEANKDFLNLSSNLNSDSSQTKQINTHLEEDFDEVATWLGEKNEESLTSSEFEKFLAERAAAAEALPSQSENNQGSSSKTKDSMYAL